MKVRVINRRQRVMGLGSTALLLAFACSTLMAAPGPSGKGNRGNPGILPPQSDAHGQSYGEWAAAWWQWALGIPAAMNPALDTTGAFAGVGQHGPVWFVAGTFGGDAERTIHVPTGKSIFMPVHNWIFGSAVGDCDPTNPGVPCDVPTLRASAAAATTVAEVVEAWIDGIAVKNVRQYRASSPEPFSITMPEGAVFGIPAATYYPQVADGYWLMLTPFSKGHHTIQTHAVNTAVGINQHVLIHLIVQ